MSDDDRSEPKGPAYQGPGREAPYPLSRLSGPVSLVDAAREIERADQWIASTTSARLSTIVEQMQRLREQAEAVMEKARRDAELHRVDARFNRLPGKIYHLYERADTTRYWSLLSPAEWGGTPPHTFIASYRLEADQSFTPVEELAKRDGAQGELAAWVKTKLLP